MRTYNRAVAYAESQHLHPSINVRRGGMCQWFARQCVGASGFGLTAIQAFHNIPSNHRHTGTPPPGSIPYWKGGSRGFGHAAFAVENGMIFSTDILRHGHVDKVHYTQIAKRWRGMVYVGYIDWTPSGYLPILSQIKPKVVAHVSRVQPGLHNGEILVVQKALHVEPTIRLNYSSGPGVFGPATKEAYAKWQRHLGFTQADADGKPGLASLNQLARRHGFLAAP